MADETKETKDAAWWENQAAQFKRELDELNPKLNVAEARIRELEATLALVERQRKDEQAAHESTEATLRAYIAEVEAANVTVSKICERLKEQAEVNAAEVGIVHERWQASAAEAARLKAACEKKTAGLQACLAGVAAQLKTIQDAIED